MDFVVKLPESRPKSGLWSQLKGRTGLPGYDSFLTVTDKLTKYVMLVPGRESWTAEEWADAYFEKVFPIFGVPAAIISDRGSVFLSLFWTTVFKRMKTDCIVTTAYNPRSDGQSERTNQVVEIALRHVVNTHQDDWATCLPDVQFAMNNSPNASTGRVPTELMMGFMPRSAIDIPTGHLTRGKEREAEVRVGKMKVMREEARDSIMLAEFTMAATYDKDRRISDIRKGDYVFVNFSKRNEAGYTAAGINAPKLGPQRVGPFLVTEMVGNNACRVDIPTDWKVWPVISIRHLIKAPSTPDTFARPTPPNARPEDEAKEIEEILDMRMMHGKKEYFVKYIGLPITRCEWVQPDSIEHARDKIERFDTESATRTTGKRKRADDAGGNKKKK
jgi:hypothetical protein